MSPFRPFAPVLAALLAMASQTPDPRAGGGADDPPPAGQAPAGLHPAVLPGTPAPTRSWAELLEREAEISFPGRSVGSALADLGLADLATDRRAAALMALGCARASGEAPRLQSAAVEGDVATRVAAVLALGEMGLRDPRLLAGLVDDPEVDVAEAAMLALLRGGGAAGRERVEGLAADPDDPRSKAAVALLAFDADPAGVESLDVEGTRAARALLELRFAAAKRHGLVRQQAWSVLVLQDLCRDEAYLDHVVYEAGAGVRRLGVQDHFLEALRKGPPAGADGKYAALEGALDAMPVEINKLVESGLWLPPDREAWTVLLQEIDRLGLESLTDGVLRAAYTAVPELETYAAGLLVRGGFSSGLARLELARNSKDPAERATVARALGTADEGTYHDVLLELQQDAAPEVRAAALVGRIVMGREDAKLDVKTRFEPPRGFDPSPVERDALEDAALIDGLCERAANSDVRALLLDIFLLLQEPQLTQVATVLTRYGRTETRDVVRAALRAGPVSGEVGAAWVRALSVKPSLEDLELLGDLFPVEGEPEVNAALAMHLIAIHDPAVFPVVRAALWTGPMSRSCLAGAVMADVAGMGALRGELLRPRFNVSSRDRRRVGFALGQFGGIEEVEALGARVSSGDPALQGALLGALAARTY